MSRITPEQRIQKAVVAIMHHDRYRALAGVLMVGKRTVGTHMGRNAIPTAATNGKDEVYNPDFIADLSDAQLRFLILHENYHKLYRHLTTWRWMYKRDPRLANQACDYVINIKLVDGNKDGFAKFIPKGCLDEKYRDWDSAAVFHDLLKKKDEGGGGGSGEDEGFDIHDWEGAEEMSEEDQQALAREIDSAIRQGALIAGKSGSGGDRSLEELMQPQVDWRTAMRDFITTTCAGSDYSTWKRPSRRYVGMGIYMPSGVSERVEDIVIGIDTSGSVGGPELASFLSEVVGIADTVKPERIHLIYWDTEVCAHEVYDATNMHTLATSTKPAGGGGTDVRCLPEYLNEHGITPQAAVILTDGYLYAGWGAWTCPTLWCILDNKSAQPDVGSVVHIRSHNLT